MGKPLYERKPIGVNKFYIPSGKGNAVTLGNMVCNYRPSTRIPNSLQRLLESFGEHRVALEDR